MKEFFYSTDKLLHILVNVLIVSIFSLIIGTWGAVFIAALISITKEYYDQIRYKGWSNLDLLADLLGILIGIL